MKYAVIALFTFLVGTTNAVAQEAPGSTFYPPCIEFHADFAANFNLPISADDADACATLMRDSMLESINRVRAEKGALPVIFDQDMARVSQTHAEALINVFGTSDTRGADGDSPNDRMRSAGLSSDGIAEVVGQWTNRDPAIFLPEFERMLRTPGFDGLVIGDPSVTRLGIGTYFASAVDERKLLGAWVVDVGR